MESPATDQRQGLAEGRPYRSHKFPACTTCRHRKGRCHVEDPAQPCRHCRQRSLACDRSIGAKAPPRMHKNPTHEASQRPSTESSNGLPARNSSLPWISFDDMQTPSESSPLMVDPTMADDIDVLERHLASRNVADSSGVYCLSNSTTLAQRATIYNRSRCCPARDHGECAGRAGYTCHSAVGKSCITQIEQSDVKMQILRQDQYVFPHSRRSILLEAMAEGSQAHFIDVDVRHLCGRLTLLDIFCALAWSCPSRCPVCLEPGCTGFEGRLHGTLIDDRARCTLRHARKANIPRHWEYHQRWSHCQSSA
jgi:hypothetical protein